MSTVPRFGGLFRYCRTLWAKSSKKCQQYPVLGVFSDTVGEFPSLLRKNVEILTFLIGVVVEVVVVVVVVVVVGVVLVVFVVVVGGSSNSSSSISRSFWGLS